VDGKRSAQYRVGWRSVRAANSGQCFNWRTTAQDEVTETQNHCSSVTATLENDDRSFNDKNSVAFQTRGYAVRVDRHGQRQLFVQFVIGAVTQVPVLCVRDHPYPRATAARLDKQSVGVDRSTSRRQSDRHAQPVIAMLVVHVYLQHDKHTITPNRRLTL